MARIWFAKDGPEPTTGKEPQYNMSIADIRAAFPGAKIRYCCGLEETPRFGPGGKAVSALRHVVCEIEKGESEEFPPAFYLIDVSVDEAVATLGTPALDGD